MNPQRLDEVRNCLGIDETTTEILRSFFDVVKDGIPGIIDEFCDCIIRDPLILRRTNGGELHLHCLKQSLIGWLNSALLGPHVGRPYLESRQRIGKVHVQIELPQEMMFTAMNCIRSRLLVIVLQTFNDAKQRNATILAVNQILDLELTLMLESYRDQQQEQLKTNERLATIGQLAASIGHELRNPLGTIETSVYLVAQRLKKLGVQDEGVQRHVDKARRQVQLCSKIINDLLELARSRPPQLQIVDVERVVDEALEALGLPETVIKRKLLAPKLTVMADPEQLRSVFVNLLENARDAIGSSGTLEVEGFTVKDGTAIWIRDSGPGIAPSDQSRIFEPLFTTKANGNGLGLALCQRIVKAHGGTIELERAGTGACFRFWLPQALAKDSEMTNVQSA